jgi:hypothetical protein
MKWCYPHIHQYGTFPTRLTIEEMISAVRFQTMSAEASKPDPTSRGRLKTFTSALNYHLKMLGELIPWYQQFDAMHFVAFPGILHRWRHAIPQGKPHSDEII